MLGSCQRWIHLCRWCWKLYNSRVDLFIPRPTYGNWVLLANFRLLCMILICAKENIVSNTFKPWKNICWIPVNCASQEWRLFLHLTLAVAATWPDVRNRPWSKRRNDNRMDHRKPPWKRGFIRIHKDSWFIDPSWWFVKIPLMCHLASPRNHSHAELKVGTDLDQRSFGASKHEGMWKGREYTKMIKNHKETTKTQGTNSCKKKTDIVTSRTSIEIFFRNLFSAINESRLWPQWQSDCCYDWCSRGVPDHLAMCFFYMGRFRGSETGQTNVATWPLRYSRKGHARHIKNFEAYIFDLVLNHCQALAVGLAPSKVFEYWNM